VDAADHLATLVGRKLDDPASRRPFLVGIAGPVAVGKSVLARELTDALAGAGRRVDVVTTDGFLLPNAVLASRELEARKGFPESYDTDRIRRFLAELREGRPEVTAPRYSHERYDVIAGDEQVVREAEVVVLEGVNALQEPIVGALDLAVYIDAHERAVFEWYAQRFGTLRAADLLEHPYYRTVYRQFAALGEGDLRDVARLVWVEVNGRNLREHILPSRDRADIVVRKGADHRVESVGPPVPR
jgi:type I pantothenate kinase